MFPVFLLATLLSPLGHVSDFAQLLRPETIVALEQTLARFEQETGNEFAVVTIEKLPADHTIETYATELFEQWGVGKEESDNGLLLLVARDDREMRIEVGYGLEGAVPDIEAGHIISEILTPAFQAGEYDAGITAAVTRLMEDAKSGAPIEPVSKPSINPGDFLPFIFFFFIFLSSVLARSKSWWAGGVVGGVVGWIFFSGLIAIGTLVAVGLIFDYIVSKTYQKSKAHGIEPPWWIGGGGKGPGGGGFGGFGGGMSGGGGSSGRW